MDRFAAMEAFTAVAEAGGFSAAARRTGKPLATLSRQVAGLESRLGVRLLNRSTRHLTLTPEGTSYLAACRGILDGLAEADRTVAGDHTVARGELVVTAPISFGRLHVVPILADLLRASPEITVRLVLSDRVLSLLEEHIDVAVRIGDLPDSSLQALRVGRIGYTVCASPAYLAARGTPAGPAGLAGHDCIAFSGVTPHGHWPMRIAGRTELVPVASRFQVTTAEAAIDAAVAGLGLTQVRSYQAEAAIADGRLASVLAAFQPEPTPLSLVHPTSRLVPARLRAFLDLAAPRLRARFAQEVAAG